MLPARGPNPPTEPTRVHMGSVVMHAIAAGQEGERQGLEYALAAILDTHSRIMRNHPPAPAPKRRAAR